jgi:hypothetical protein
MRPGYAELIKLAAELVRGDPIKRVDQLFENSGRTLGKNALLDALEDAEDRLKAAAFRLRQAADRMNKP